MAERYVQWLASGPIAASENTFAALRAAGFSLLFADAPEALTPISARVFVLDASLPPEPGLQTPAETDPPTIFILTSTAVDEQVLPSLRPQDDVSSPQESPREFVQRLFRAIDRGNTSSELAQRRQHVDPMTQLPDRLRCLQWFETDDNAWSSVHRGLLLLDIDFFNRFNEAYGRAAGDWMLAEIARVLRNLAQPQDLLFRLELEEFVIIIERESREIIAAQAEEFRRAVSAATYLHEDQPVHITASAGLAFLRPEGFRYGALQQAETAMYMAKIVGRDTLVLHDDVRRLAMNEGATLELADLSELADAAKARLSGMADRFNKRLLEAAQRDANIDSLTQSFNRRYFDHRIEREMELARRDQRVLSLALLDIDDFREFNKEHGHPTGDLVLRRFAEIAKKSVRNDDWFARYGGEEFCLVTSLQQNDAYKVAERIRAAVARAKMQSIDGREITITVSIGLVTFDPVRDAGSEYLVQRASRANRVAKDRGKNLVIVE